MHGIPTVFILDKQKCKHHWTDGWTLSPFLRSEFRRAPSARVLWCRSKLKIDRKEIRTCKLQSSNTCHTIFSVGCQMPLHPFVRMIAMSLLDFVPHPLLSSSATSWRLETNFCRPGPKATAHSSFPPPFQRPLRSLPRQERPISVFEVEARTHVAQHQQHVRACNS